VRIRAFGDFRKPDSQWNGFALAREFVLQRFDDRGGNARLPTTGEFTRQLPRPGITDVERGGQTGLPLQFHHLAMRSM
jgi:hypothetical protein